MNTQTKTAILAMVIVAATAALAIAPVLSISASAQPFGKRETTTCPGDSGTCHSTSEATHNPNAKCTVQAGRNGITPDSQTC